jgi:hypothetical protein
MTAAEAILAVFGGSFFGTFLGPVLVDEWRRYRHYRTRLTPRQPLIRKYFEASPAPVIALRDLSRAVGLSDEECRDLLVSMGAIGATLENGEEGWCMNPTQLMIVTRWTKP